MQWKWILQQSDFESALIEWNKNKYGRHTVTDRGVVLVIEIRKNSRQRMTWSYGVCRWVVCRKFKTSSPVPTSSVSNIWRNETDWSTEQRPTSMHSKTPRRETNLAMFGHYERACECCGWVKISTTAFITLPYNLSLTVSSELMSLRPTQANACVFMSFM